MVFYRHLLSISYFKQNNADNNKEAYKKNLRKSVMALKKVIGLDFGSSNIRAIEVLLDKTGKVKMINSVYKQPLQTQVITNGNVVSYASLVSSIKQLFSKNNIKEKSVFISINGESIISRNLSGIETEKDESVFSKTLSYKLKDLIPIEWNENEYNYHTISEYVDESSRKILRDIIFVAINKSNIKQILTAVHEAELEPHVVDIAPLGILRASICAEDTVDKRIACIDIGGDTTNIVIHKNGYPEYIRTITGIGGNVIDQRISSELSVSINDAELQKFKALSKENLITQKSTSMFAAKETGGIDPDSQEAVNAEIVNNIVAQEISVVVSQVRDTFTDATFHSGTIDSPIEQILLSGGGVGIQTLASRLQNELNDVPVFFTDPLSKLAGKELLKQISDGTVIPHEYTVAFGLVSRIAGENK